jgi:hypothetical protein
LILFWGLGLAAQAFADEVVPRYDHIFVIVEE